MNPRPHLFAAVATAILSVAAIAAPVLAANPVDDGCPASTDLYSVAWLEGQGPYLLPARLDDPANGGNGDGDVCAFPLPETVADAHGADVTVYQFFENNLGSRQSD